MIQISKSTGKKVVWWTAIVSAGIATTLAGAWVYKQMKKMEDYIITKNKIIVKKVSPTQIIIDLFMDFTNKSNLSVTLANQEYDIYLNDNYVTTLKNDKPNDVAGQSVSTIGMQLDFNPTKLLLERRPNKIVNPLDFFTNPKNIKVKIIMKYKVKVLFLNIPIPEIIYQDNLGNLI